MSSGDALRRWRALPPERRVTSLVALVLGAVMLTLTGSQGTGRGGTVMTDAGAEVRAHAAAVRITPDDGSRKVRPDRPIVVQAAHGKLQDVVISNKGRKLDGELSADGTRWRSRWTLAPSTRYTVSATALGGDGKTTTTKSSFTTLKPKQTVSAFRVAPDDGEKVGVGMPIIVGFDQPVRNREEVERALEVRMSKPVEGAWRWMTDQEVVFRTKKYWPKGTKVTVVAHLSGVRAAKNVYGNSDLKTKFTVGNAVISTISTKKHTMTVKRNGKTIRKFPISAGNGSTRAYTTTNGVHLAMSMEYHVVMDSATVGIPKGHPDYYRMDVNNAVRISNSGEYTHSAPWSVGSQGRANVSHGCVNQSPGDAKWFKEMTHRGDVVIVTGTNRELEYNNGWGYWQMSWKTWKRGSAAKLIVNPQSATPSVPTTMPSVPATAPAAPSVPPSAPAVP